MEIVDILAKYSRSAKPAPDPSAPLLPPIDQSNNHMLPLLPSTPRHVKSKPSKAKVAVVPHYFTRSPRPPPGYGGMEASMYDAHAASKIPQYEATIHTMEQEVHQVMAEHNLVNKMKGKPIVFPHNGFEHRAVGYAAANAALTDSTTKLTAELNEALAKVADLMATNQALVHTMKRQDDRQKEHESQVRGKLRNSIVTLEDKAGGVDINADRRTIEHLTREVQELMAYRVAHDKPETIVGDVFVGKGTGDAVPDYLHYDGYIRNKFYSKRDTERLISSRNLRFTWQQGQPTLNYTTLLEQDRNGNQSSFCECIRNQHLDELTTLKRSLLVSRHHELRVEERRAGPDNNGMLSLDSVRRVIRRCDPSRPAAAVNVLMAECTALPLDRVETETATLVNAHGVRTKLVSMLIKPAGKLPVLP
ncbi:hypothetical protein DYB26_007888 [Aphanomyces astaci]|uniref:Uncharacterized protein n=1 Tax=Aphanomyces astaci TaxID=112090 RepID=A0A418EAH8_APHAT|nr:hypothetical protein DYB26_007888 [Aphanomyces astaci]